MEYRRLVDNTPALFGSASLDGKFVKLSPRWSDVLGYALDELQGRVFLDLVHPDDLENTRNAIAGMERGEEIIGFVNRYQRKDGRYVAIEWRSSLGADSLIYFVADEVTQRYELQHQLQDSLQRLEDVAEIAGIGGWVIDMNDMIPRWDDKTCEIHEVEPGYIPDLDTAINFYAPEARDMVAKAVDGGIQRGEGWTFEAPLITAKGNRIWVRASGRVIKKDGVPVRLAGIFQDITESKSHALLLESALKRSEELQSLAEEATEAAEAASLAKSQFLANMSHEIRTPLNGMMGMLQLIKRTELSDKQSLFVNTLEASGRALQNLIEDILDISRIEAGQITLVEEPFDIGELVSDTLSVVRAEAESRGLTLNGALDAELALTRYGDAKRVQQVLLNLVGNAVKFTKTGSVEVRVTEPRPGVVRCTVTDTGPGVPEALQSIIFDRFAQADQSSRKSHDGVGLGLAISKELVDMAGGSIGLESTLGEGARFWFDWPLPPTDAPVEADAAPRPLILQREGGRVLIAEDKPANFLVLKVALEAAGFEVLHAETGLEAVELSAAHQPDVILMDIHMPKMAGDEAIERIRAGGHAPAIYAVTADATPATREKVEQLGVEGVFIKPYDLDEIVDAAERAAQTAHHAAERSPAALS